MAFETGASASNLALLASLKAFCEANGWTTDRYSVDGNGQWWHAHTAYTHIDVKACVNEALGGLNSSTSTGIVARLATGYDAGQPWTNQPGKATMVAAPVFGADPTAGLFPTTAILSYYFFAANDFIHVVCETSAGVFKRLSFGNLAKFGAWPGGATLMATDSGQLSFGPSSVPFPPFPGAQNVMPNSQVRAIIDSYDGYLIAGFYSQNKQVYDNYAAGFFTTLLDSSPNAFNNLSVLLPFYLFTNRDGVAGYCPIGQIPDFFYCNIRYLTPGQVYAVGGIDYRVFPPSSKDNTSGTWRGYAIRVSA